jgi:hypothetical protein
MQLMATMRYLNRLETKMSRDQFEDLVRKVKLAIATRIRTSASGAAVLEDADQVSRYFILLYIITSQTQNTSINCILLRITCIYYELWGYSHIFRAQEHGRQPAPLNVHLSIISNNFLNFYNIINIIIFQTLKLYYNYIVLYSFNFITF